MSVLALAGLWAVVERMRARPRYGDVERAVLLLPLEANAAHSPTAREPEGEPKAGQLLLGDA